MNGDYECMVCGYTEHNPISQTCPSCHHTTMSIMTTDIEIAEERIDALTARIAELEGALKNVVANCFHIDNGTIVVDKSTIIHAQEVLK